MGERTTGSRLGHPGAAMAVRILTSDDAVDFRELVGASVSLPDAAVQALTEWVSRLRPFEIEHVEELSTTAVAVTGRNPGGDRWRVVVAVESEPRHGLTDLDGHPCLDVVEWKDLRPEDAVDIVGAETERSGALAELLRDLRREWRLPGLTAALRTDVGRTRLTVGFADPWARLPVDGCTYFRLASLVKGFTSVAALQLVEQGLLDLDEPVAPMVGIDLPPDLSLRHLLTHTSGLDPQAAPVHGHAPATPRSARDVLERGVRVLAAPGTTFAYSNLGFGLVGLVVEAVSGSPITQALTELAGRAIGAAIELDEHDGHASGTALEGGAVVPAPDVHPSLIAAGGGWATADGAVRLAEALLPGATALPATVRRWLTTNQAPPGTGVRSAGLALYGDGARWVGHVGGWPGFSGAVLACPERGVAVSVLTNQSTPHRRHLPERLIHALDR